MTSFPDYNFESDMKIVSEFFSEYRNQSEENPAFKACKPEALMDSDVRRAWDRVQTVNLEADMSLMDTLDDEIMEVKQKNKHLIHVIETTRILIAYYARKVAPYDLPQIRPLTKILDILDFEIEKAKGHAE